ncbi:MAG: RDD family protein [Bacteroidales bacterium]|nr:RDD family protein [Bacteroidales bacterium]
MKPKNNHIVPNQIAVFAEQRDVLGLSKSKRTGAKHIKYKSINAPELNVTYAGLGIRSVAKLIDLVIVFAILLLLEAVFLKFNFENNEYTLFRILIIGVAWLVYNGLFESSIFQGTIGKMAVKIKVIGLYGKELTVLRALSRCIAVIISVLPMGLGIWYITTDKKKRGWHDLIAGSFVIRN